MVALVTGGTMHSYGDQEFDDLQRWYHPGKIRTRLENYREILYPHISEDQRGMPKPPYAPWHVPVQDRANTKADLDRALIWLQYVAGEANAAEAIYLYYLSLRSDGKVHTQEDVARIMHCTERTVRNRIRAGIRQMSWYLGYFEDR